MVTVRAATIVDAEAVEGACTQVAAEGEWIGPELPLAPGWQDDFRAAVGSPDSTWFVADVDGLIVGAVFVRKERGLAHVGMAIVDSHRGRGIGRRLLEAAIDWARATQCHKIVLEVWPHNARARRLYEAAGFTDEGYLRRQYRRRSGALWDVIA
ncbi:MAG TPA: GNAT family N-acetyltransferase, partial [Acidimicrobiales bacterium]